jgi:cytochrome b pre-mRNA-processing protein 3
MLGLFSRKRADSTIERLYGVIVAQARRPAFYTHYAVPDTLDGRFDLLVLHVALFFRRAREDEAIRDLGQAVFDRFCLDMDRSLREIGIGDTGVPRHMRRMGEAFYGRAAAYEAALAKPRDEALAAALSRNVFATAEPGRNAHLLAAYVKDAIAHLAGQDGRDIAQGLLSFPDPEIAQSGTHERAE